MALWRTVKIFKKFIVAIVSTPFSILVQNYTSGVKWKNKIKAICIPQSPSLTRDISSYTTTLDINDSTGAITGDIVYNESGGLQTQPIVSLDADGRLFLRAFCVTGTHVTVNLSIIGHAYLESAVKSSGAVFSIHDVDTNATYHTFPKIVVQSGVKKFLQTTLTFNSDIVRKIYVKGIFDNYDFMLLIWDSYLGGITIINDFNPFIPYNSTGKSNVLSFRKVNIEPYINTFFQTTIPPCHTIVFVLRSFISNNNVETLQFGENPTISHLRPLRLQIYIDGVLKDELYHYKYMVSGQDRVYTIFDNIISKISGLSNTSHTIEIKGTRNGDYSRQTIIPELVIYYSDVTTKHVENLNVIAFEGED